MAMVKAADLIVGAGGSSKKNDDKPNVSEDWTRFGKKQILTIGKKRRHHVHDDVNEDDIADIDEGHASSSDEEEGRTSAVREKKKRKPVVQSGETSPGSGQGAASSAGAAESTQPKKTKKKKKGKKERAKEGMAEGDQSKDITSDAPTTKEDGPTKNEAAEDSTGTPASQNNDTKPRSEANKPNIKRKRKKIRSRQKNIRKDTRSTESKPSHLVVGSGADYKGRPLTDATRKKLGIEPKHVTKKGNKGASRVEEALDTGEWVGDGIDETKAARENGEEGGEDVTKETKSKTEEKVLVKVGDCIVSGDTTKGNESKKQDDVGESLSRGKGEKKKRKKQPKRKFKNLAV